MNLQDKFKKIVTLQFVKLAFNDHSCFYAMQDNYIKQQEVNSGHTL